MKLVKAYKSKYDGGSYINCAFCDDARSDIDDIYVLTAPRVKGKHTLNLCRKCFLSIKNGEAHT